MVGQLRRGTAAHGCMLYGQTPMQFAAQRGLWRAAAGMVAPAGMHCSLFLAA